MLCDLEQDASLSCVVATVTSLGSCAIMWSRKETYSVSWSWCLTSGHVYNLNNLKVKKTKNNRPLLCFTRKWDGENRITADVFHVFHIYSAIIFLQSMWSASAFSGMYFWQLLLQYSTDAVNSSWITGAEISKSPSVRFCCCSVYIWLVLKVCSSFFSAAPWGCVKYSDF